MQNQLTLSILLKFHKITLNKYLSTKSLNSHQNNGLRFSSSQYNYLCFDSTIATFPGAMVGARR